MKTTIKVHIDIQVWDGEHYIVDTGSDTEIKLAGWATQTQIGNGLDIICNSAKTAALASCLLPSPDEAKEVAS